MNENKELFEQFFQDITGWNMFSDGYIEIVDNFKKSKYVPEQNVAKIYDEAMRISNDKRECHFGPAVRKANLGPRRSDRDNVIYSKALWLDIDSPDKTLSEDDRLLRAKELLDRFLDALKTYDIKPSYIISSGHGFHLYFVMRKLYYFPATQWEIMQAALVDLAGSDLQAKDITRLLRVPLTFNYKDPASPKPVEFVTANRDIFDEKNFLPIIEAYKAKVKTVAPHKPSSEDQKPLGFIPPCIQYLLNPAIPVKLGHRHEARFVIGTFGFHEGWSVEETIQKVSHFTEDPRKSEKDIQGIYEALFEDPDRYAVGCNDGSQLKALVDAGVTVCDKTQCRIGKVESDEGDQPQTEFSANFPGLIDLVIDDHGQLVFLVKEGDQLIMKDKVITQNSILVPPPDDQIIWSLPKGSEVIRHFTEDSDSGLLQDLVSYHQGISSLPSDNHYKFLALWVAHTYLIDKFEYSPIPWLYGIAERGKSRTGKGAIYAAYRGVHVITIRDPHLLRMATDLKATMFIDVMDLWGKAIKEGAEDVLLCRFEKGSKVPRVLHPEKGKFRDTTYFDVYGGTIIATNEPVGDIMATRTIPIIMPESAISYERDVKKEMGLPFRERLLAFRARWIDRDLPMAEKPSSGRLGDMLRPLRQVLSTATGDHTWFLEFAKELELQKRGLASDSLEAQTVSAIIEAKTSIKNGHLLNEDVLIFVNARKSDRERITPQKLGKVISRLGFEKYTSGSERGFYFKEDLLNRLCQRYGINQNPSPPDTMAQKQNNVREKDLISF